MKNFIKSLILLLMIIMGIGFTSCDPPEIDSKEIIAFGIAAGNNADLSTDCLGKVDGTNITVTVPHGTDLTQLVPTVVIRGKSLSPAGNQEQDFSQGTFEYTVTAEDGSANSYSVNVIAQAKWTVLIHFAVDNDIDYQMESTLKMISRYIKTLKKVKNADTEDKINIVMLLDAYDDDNINYQSPYTDGYYLLSGEEFSLDNFKNDLKIKIDEVNSGNVQDSKDFIDWAVKYYPAEKFMYSIFNHGSGFDDNNINGTRGIGFDHSDNSNSLSHNELGQITAHFKEKIGKKIDLFYPFACLMGSVELAYELKDNVNYLLSSEEIATADPYSSYERLDKIVTEPEISAEDLARTFCDSAYEYFNGPLGSLFVKRFILSLVDLNKIEALSTSINEYADVAINDIESNTEKAIHYNAAASINLINTSGNPSEKKYRSYIDLGNYLTEIKDNPEINDEVKNKAINVMKKLDDCVIHKVNKGFDEDGGLSIFHNVWNEKRQYSVNLYISILTFGADNAWTKYIEKVDASNN